MSQLTEKQKGLAVQAADDCLKALSKDQDLETAVFLENWAEEHDIPPNQLIDFEDRATAQLVDLPAFLSLVAKATPLSDLLRDMSPGLDSEEYTRSRTYSLHSKVHAMFEPRGERHKEWAANREDPRYNPLGEA